MLDYSDEWFLFSYKFGYSHINLGLEATFYQFRIINFSFFVDHGCHNFEISHKLIHIVHKNKHMADSECPYTQESYSVFFDSVGLMLGSNRKKSKLLILFEKVIVFFVVNLFKIFNAMTLQCYFIHTFFQLQLISWLLTVLLTLSIFSIETLKLKKPRKYT